MKRSIVLCIIIGLFLVGCGQHSTKKQVYSDSWDGIPIIVKQMNDTGDNEIIHEITDAATVEKLVETLASANWEENIDVDIRPADVQFTWNSFEHNVWRSGETGRVELTINGRSNYVLLSEKSSNIVIEMLTGEKFD